MNDSDIRSFVSGSGVLHTYCFENWEHQSHP